jgi:predicted PurR-regulated permease PerM
VNVRNQVLSWTLLFGVLIFLLIFLHEVLFPFVAGFAIAYLLDPICDWLERMGLSRGWATALLTALFFVLFVLVLALLVPVLYNQLIQFLNNLPRYAAAIESKAGPLMEAARGYLSTEDGVSKVKEFVQSHLGDVAKIAVRFLGGFVGGLQVTFNIISLFVITPVVAFYLLRDWDVIVERVDSWLPRAHLTTIREQAGLVDQTLAGFLRGQFTVCLLLGLFYGVGLSLVGLDFGLVVGLGTGFVSFVPYFGMLIGFAVGMGLALAQFDSLTQIGMVAGVFVLGQLIEGNFLTPKLVGDRVNLHPVWILFALLAGGALFGFVDILLAVPIAAVIGVALRFTLLQYRQSTLYLGAPPPRSPPLDRMP